MACQRVRLRLGIAERSHRAGSAKPYRRSRITGMRFVVFAACSRVAEPPRPTSADNQVLPESE